ncbi:MAG: Gfo/Idh/MocA family oxidoreductase [Bryobacteraceae bacterium]
MSDVSRRTFFQGALLAASANRVMGANDKINVGIVGLGTRGSALIQYCAKIPEARVAGLCDVKQEARERAQALLQQLVPGEKAKEFVDMREMFAEKGIDAVLLSVPVHWHGLATVWGCEAGKDVYVEKPASYNIHESRRMIETARKTNRMVGVGLQSRSMGHKIRAMQLLRDGVIGKVYMSKGLCFKPRPSMGKTPPEPVPPGVNWDLFVGPAPMRPYTRNRINYTWNWLWDYGAGDITNAGAHEFDTACWGLGDPGMPKAALCSGGKYVWDDDQEAPNTQYCAFDYGDRELVFEIRALPSGPEAGEPVVTGVTKYPWYPGGVQGHLTVGNLFMGGNGWMWLDGSGFKVHKGEGNEVAMEEKADSLDRSDQVAHVRNFLLVCQSRKVQDLHCPIEVGATSSAVCHLATISYRVGRKVVWDDAKGQFVNDAEADRLISRDYRKPYVV